jgi:pimeloyl-ACP methyl ester carboxylesterase
MRLSALSASPRETGLIPLLQNRRLGENPTMLKRIVLVLFLLLVTGVAPAFGQAMNPDVAWGRDYSFERMVATRKVHDADDKGTIRLVTYVYRPVKNDRREVVLFAHGSTAGLARSPKEPGSGAAPPPLINYFVSRGYTVVAPTRRGRGESTGTYVEECSAYTGDCTTAQQLALGARGIREALLDMNAVIDQLILGKLARRDAKIVLAGHSRGGFLSLLLAGERPALVSAVFNFAGGWYGVTDRLSEAERQQRMDDQKTRLKRAAQRTTAPAIWVYVAGDAFYKEGVPQELHAAWREAGGRGEFVYVTDVPTVQPHQFVTDPRGWGERGQALLDSLKR